MYVYIFFISICILNFLYIIVFIIFCIHVHLYSLYTFVFIIFCMCFYNFLYTFVFIIFGIHLYTIVLYTFLFLHLYLFVSEYIVYAKDVFPELKLLSNCLSSDFVHPIQNNTEPNFLQETFRWLQNRLHRFEFQFY